MAARDALSGLGCLFRGVVIVGYLLAAWVFHSWSMLVAPFALGGIVIVWAIVRSRSDED